ncbi:MFS transporter [Candidatus Omnitrophota bacterium]
MGKRTFSILLMAAFSASLGLGVISPFLPELVGRHRANGLWIAAIFTGFALSRAIVMPFVGRLSDRYGRKIFVAGGLLLFAVISLFYPKAHSLFSLTLVRMVHGLAAGMIIPIVVAYAAECATEGERGTTSGWLLMMFYFGLATGPFMGGFINQELGFAYVFYAMAFMAFIAFLIVLFFLKDSKDEQLQAHRENAIPFRELIKYNYIKAVLLIAVVTTVLIVIFMAFVPSLAAQLNIDPDHIGIIISVGILLAGALQIPFGKFSDRLNRTGKLLQISAGTSVSMIALFVMPFCPDFAALLVAGSFLGLGSAISMPAIMSLSMSIGDEAGMGSWMGIINSARSIGFMGAPLIAGVVMDHMGVSMVFYVMGVLVFFCGGLYLYFVYRRLTGHVT